MKNLIIFTITLFVSLTSFAQQTVSHIETGDTFTTTTNNVKTKTIFTKLKSQITKKALVKGDIQFFENTLSLTIDTVEYIHPTSGKVRISKKSTYTLNGVTYTKISDLKKDIKQPTAGLVNLNGNIFDFSNKSMTLTNQTKKQLVTAYLYTINVRTSKENPIAMQTLTILDKTFEISKASKKVEYVNASNPKDTKEYTESIYAVNGVTYSKIGDVKKAIKLEMGIE